MGALTVGAPRRGCGHCASRDRSIFYGGCVCHGNIFCSSTSAVFQVHKTQKFGVGRRIFLMAPLHHHYEAKRMERNASGSCAFGLLA